MYCSFATTRIRDEVNNSRIVYDVKRFTAGREGNVFGDIAHLFEEWALIFFGTAIGYYYLRHQLVLPHYRNDVHSHCKDYVLHLNK